MESHFVSSLRNTGQTYLSGGALAVVKYASILEFFEPHRMSSHDLLTSAFLLQ